MSEWIYYLVHPFTGEVLEELPLVDFGYRLQLDNAGGFEFSIPISHPKASASLLRPGQTLVYVENGGRLQFGGVMWAAEATPGGTVDCGGQGIWSLGREDRRRVVSRQAMAHATGFTADEVSWDQVDQFDVAADIVNHYNDAVGSVDFGSVVMHGPGANDRSGILIDQYLWTFESPPICETIEDLANRMPGFDFTISHKWTDERTIEREFHLWYPRAGSRLGLVLELGKNFRMTSYRRDASRMATDVLATGAGSGDNLFQALVSDDTIAWPAGAYPRILQVESYPDIDDEAVLASLGSRALQQLNEPMQTVTGEVILGVDTVIGTFNPGDSVYVEAHDGWIDVSGWYRIEELGVKIDVNGQETVAVSLTSEHQSLGQA